MSWLTIDGRTGEGGGQLSRYAVALAAISGRPRHLLNIRARRASPGLMAQHLTALRAAAEVGGGVLEGAAVDIHACDQLLIYAAQAQGTSRFLVRKVSRHARTVMWLIEQFLAVGFRGEPRQGLYWLDVNPGQLS